MADLKYDIYLVGVGGQGVLTIGELITGEAIRRGIPANFYPTKGMAQRGGFVKAQLRLGRGEVGPDIPEQGADLVISMERSESLKAVRYVKPGGSFIIYDHVWAPTAVMLGKAPYPTLEQVGDEIEKAGASVYYIDPKNLPHYNGQLVPDNIFMLGVTMGQTTLKNILDSGDMMKAIETRWKRSAERNLFAFSAGLTAGVGCSCPPVARERGQGDK
ncbi:MAG: indolepyruvate ferredoxin oxidoreductase, beta subunit [Clostridia bacterium]|nr:indolepyruvate ferredoxin oxidoreductase, beta subunit [Clostridia bacterium]